jgi:hypothetical protein
MKKEIKKGIIFIGISILGLIMFIILLAFLSYTAYETNCIDIQNKCERIHNYGYETIFESGQYIGNNQCNCYLITEDNKLVNHEDFELTTLIKLK